MIETLAAVSLASSIVQFVDFGTKLLSNGRELYQSAEGALQENVELGKIIENIKSTAQSITNNAISINDDALREMAGACKTLADELLAVLHSLKIDNTKNRPLEIIRKSLKSFRYAARLKRIYERLCTLQDQVCFQLNGLLSGRHATLLPAIHEFLDATKTLGTETQDKLDRIRTEIQTIIHHSAWKKGDDDAFSRLSESLTNLVGRARTTRNVHEVLKSLHFKQIKERQFEVKNAHTNTFEWIFDEDDKNDFVQWLRIPSGTFWMAGKAGSGKSTLMKFLSGHSRLRSLLRPWANGKEILIASHFFWTAGTAMQKSQEDLLRALLFQILARCPEIIPIICPSRWNTDETVNSFPSLEPWSLTELSQALRAFANLEQLSVRLCILVDGLDEYDGEHSEIIRIVKTIAKSPFIKIFVSSRPWTVFVDAFNESKWKLYLQDMTRNDIRRYINDILEEDASFQELKARESSGSEKLVQQIVSKAQGVFLWVYLVVRSLLRGLTNRDDMSDLESRLKELPGHLKTYFRHMLNTIEDVYQQQTARTFRIMANASTTLPLIALYFVDQETSEHDYALNRDILDISHSRLLHIVDTKRRQLNARCKDLIEVITDPDEPFFLRYRAAFLHRTVMDLLQQKDMEILMSTRSGSDFNPNLSLCRAYLAQVKALPPACESKNLILRNLILGVIYYEHNLEVLDGTIGAALLDELNKTLSALNQRNLFCWRDVFPGYSVNSILDIAVRSGLELYVGLKVQACPEIVRKGTTTSLLHHALEESIYIRKEFRFEPCFTSNVDISMVRLLLEHRADPLEVWNKFLNRCYVPTTKPIAWDMTHHLHQDERPPRPQDRLSNAYDVWELLIIHTRGKYDRSASIVVFEEIFTRKEAKRLIGLMEERIPRNETLYVERKYYRPWWDVRRFIS